MLELHVVPYIYIYGLASASFKPTCFTYQSTGLPSSFMQEIWDAHRGRAVPKNSKDMLHKILTVILAPSADRKRGSWQDDLSLSEAHWSPSIPFSFVLQSAARAVKLPQQKLARCHSLYSIQYEWADGRLVRMIYLFVYFLTRSLRSTQWDQVFVYRDIHLELKKGHA